VAIIRQQFKTLSYQKHRAERISQGERGDVAQDWDCNQFCGQLFYDSPISQAIQSPTRGLARGGPSRGVFSCIDREQGDPSFKAVGLWSSFQSGRYCISRLFRKCRRCTAPVTVKHSLLSLILTSPLQPPTPQDATVACTPTRPDNKRDTIS
jgi:hypothetical protein